MPLNKMIQNSVAYPQTNFGTRRDPASSSQKVCPRTHIVNIVELQSPVEVSNTPIFRGQGMGASNPFPVIPNPPNPLIFNPPNIVPVCNKGEVLLGGGGGLVLGGRDY